MKIKDIKPGMLVVAHKKGYGLEEFRQGREGMDAVVLAVGQYRLQKQGVCGTVIAVPNPYDSTKKVVIMRPRILYTDVQRTTEWVVDLVSPTYIMPLAEHKERFAEWRFIKDEQDRLVTLKNELLHKVGDLVNADTNVRKEVARLAEISPWQSGGLLTLTVRTGYIRLDPSICTAKTKKALAPIMEDLINIDKQLTCKV